MKKRQFSVNDLKTTGERLKFAIDRAGLNYYSLSKISKISTATISNIVNNKAPINAHTIKLSLILDVDPIWLETGKLTYTVKVVKGYAAKDIKESPERPVFQPWVPIFPWNGIGKLIQKKDLKKYKWEQMLLGGSPETFALIMEDISMLAPYPSPQNFYPGEVLFIDPLREIYDGCFMVIQLPDHDTAILRQYVKDGGNYWLKPLNPSFPAIPFSLDLKCHGVFYKSNSEKK